MNIPSALGSPSIPASVDRSLANAKDVDQDVLKASQLLSNEAAAPEKNDELREAFNDFVGQTLFGQLMKSMRSTVGKPAYFHGGRTEEIFQGQLDAVMTEELTEASAKSFGDPMFELFQLNRQ